MFCPPCAEAGQLNAAGEHEAAVIKHKECPGGTWCDCQHYTGVVPTPIAVSAAGVAERLTEPHRPIVDVPTHHFSELQRLERAYNLGRDDALRSVEHMTGYTPRLLGL